MNEKLNSEDRRAKQSKAKHMSGKLNSEDSRAKQSKAYE